MTTSKDLDHRLIIVGAGQAGAQAAASLREKGWLGAITIVGDEGRLPYYRPPLSKEFLYETRLPDDEVTLHHASFYEKHGVSLLLDDPAVRIDRDRRVVVLASAIELAYDELILATGAESRVPRSLQTELSGVLTLRTWDDAELLRTALLGCERLVVIGGGFIGTEIAASASARCSVTIIEPRDRVLKRVVSPELSGWLQARHESNGVRVLTGVGATGLVGSEGKVSKVALNEGSLLPADLVLLSTGAAPRTALAEAAGLSVQDGILVDTMLRTSDPRIYAIGDCARFFLPDQTETIRLESVQNAVDQARHVAATITGAVEEAYRAVPWFWTHQYGAKIQIAGLSHIDDESHLAGESTERFSVHRHRGGELVAVESVNAPRDHIVARKQLAAALDSAVAQ